MDSLKRNIKQTEDLVRLEDGASDMDRKNLLREDFVEDELQCGNKTKS